MTRNKRTGVLSVLDWNINNHTCTKLQPTITSLSLVAELNFLLSIFVLGQCGREISTFELHKRCILVSAVLTANAGRLIIQIHQTYKTQRKYSMLSWRCNAPAPPAVKQQRRFSVKMTRGKDARKASFARVCDRKEDDRWRRESREARGGCYKLKLKVSLHFASPAAYSSSSYL